MLIAGNWKMFKGPAETAEFCIELKRQLPELEGLDVAVCPPFASLAVAVQILAGTEIAVAAQNVHWEDEGAFTGEVSAPMLLELGVSAVVLGHSERRQYYAESDAALARKVPVALAAGLEPILCVGESEAERDAGKTEAVLTRQVNADLEGVEGDDLKRVVIAYEPIWAIGTGRTASADQAEEAIAFIRSLIASRDAGAAEAIRILYGGSVKSGNIAGFMRQPDVDGALVGGASLQIDEFSAIVRFQKHVI